VIFTLIDQTLEVYRAIASDQNLLSAFFSTFFVTILSVLIWYAARLLQLCHPPNQLPIDSQEKTALQTKWLAWLDNFLPRLLGITPLLALAQGIGLAFEHFSDQLFLKIWLGINVGIAIIVFLTVTYRVEIFERFLPKLAKRDRDEGLFGTNFENVFINAAFFVLGLSTLPFVFAATGSFWSFGILAIFGLQIGLNVLLWLWGNYDKPDQSHNPSISASRVAESGITPNQQSLIILVTTGIAACVLLLAATFNLPATFFPDWFGSVSVVAISLSIMVVIFATIYNWGMENKVPAITLLIIAIFTSSFFNWNDNHRFRRLAAPVPPLLGLEASFQAWLESRPDRLAYTQANKPYPVYLVSAQGGGIFAAYHAANALSRLSGYSPQFPHHIFAISSVSGGSIGSSIFTSLVRANQQPAPALQATEFSQYADKIFKQDLLSPLLTMGLFPDLVQRFLPWPAITNWDRATGLEIALEKAWDRTKLPVNNPFKESFYPSAASPDQAPTTPALRTPALVINTTVVESGERLLFSPFQVVSASRKPLSLANPQVNLRLSTAAALSARFPYVTPVGWFENTQGQKTRLVDGGYFDNSGVPTALDMGRALQRLKGYDQKFKIIYLALVDQPNPNPENQPENESLNELASPLRAVFRARDARGRSAAELSTFTLNEDIKKPFELRFRTLYLQKAGKLFTNNRAVQLPLGWLLSDASKAFIAQQTQAPEQCNSKQFADEFKRGRPDPEVYNHNSCVAKSIEQDLQPAST
jgi:predicted acylesterase/phospholipase RssA